MTKEELLERMWVLADRHSNCGSACDMSEEVFELIEEEKHDQGVRAEGESDRG